VASTREDTRFFAFEFSTEKRCEMQALLRSVLRGDYDGAPEKGFRVYPRMVAASPIPRGKSEQIRLEHADVPYHQPSLTDSELSDDEFSDDEFSDDNID
jgi:hypothetical protein